MVRELEELAALPGLTVFEEAPGRLSVNKS
jgi:hypothetical protein